MNPSGDPPAEGPEPAARPAPEPAAPARLRRVVRTLVPVAALGVLVAGIVMLAQPAQPESTGWFAYAPLSQQMFTPGNVLVMDPGRWAGAWLTGAGLVVLAFWAGYRTGRRRRRAAS